MNEQQQRLQTRFQRTEFLISGNDLSHLPKGNHLEVAFAGRSNAGKSSALNVITSQAHLARISKTPGRTQLINIFKVNEQNFLVDLPGYGYAKVPEAMRNHWKIMLQSYFEKRENLRGLIMMMDVRHPLTPLDCQMLAWCDARKLSTHILLTKADKLKRGPQMSALMQVKKHLAQEYNFDVSVQLFSSTSKDGLLEAWQKLDYWLKPSKV
ncbi:cell division GTP-binding protein [Gammaproteobacteria bacterium]|nr:cell division GTP-binding protein [Gammaproteobacteria bacterium]